jgi:hypothetical protein
LEENGFQRIGTQVYVTRFRACKKLSFSQYEINVSD